MRIIYVCIIFLYNTIKIKSKKIMAIIFHNKIQSTKFIKYQKAIIGIVLKIKYYIIDTDPIKHKQKKNKPSKL